MLINGLNLQHRLCEDPNVYLNKNLVCGKHIEAYLFKIKDKQTTGAVIRHQTELELVFLVNNSNYQEGQGRINMAVDCRICKPTV